MYSNSVLFSINFSEMILNTFEQDPISFCNLACNKKFAFGDYFLPLSHQMATCKFFLISSPVKIYQTVHVLQHVFVKGYYKAICFIETRMADVPLHYILILFSCINSNNPRGNFNVILH